VIVGVIEGVMVIVGVTEGEIEMVGVIVGVMVGVCDIVTVTVGVGVGVSFCVLVNVIVGETVGVIVICGVAVACGVGVTEATGGITLSLLLFAKEPDRISVSKEANFVSPLALALCKSLLLGGRAIY
jgi:hypothetical protein